MKKAKNQFTIDFSVGSSYDYSSLPENYIYVDKPDSRILGTIFDRVLSSTEVAFDIETMGDFRADGLRAWKGKIRLLQFGLRDGTVFIIDTQLLNSDSTKQVQTFLRTFLADPKIKKITHNGKFDFVFCIYWLGRNTRIQNCFDTYITSVMLYSGLAISSAIPLIRFGLGACVERELDIKIDKTLQASEWGNANLSPEQLLYASKDVEILFPLMDALKAHFTDPDRRKCVEIENHAVPVMARMQANGMPIDVELTKTAAEKHRQLHQEKVAEFHIGYPGQKTGGSTLLKHINHVKEEELKDAKYDELFKPGFKDNDMKKLLKSSRILPELTADVLAVLSQTDEALAALTHARTLEKSLNYLDNMLLNVRGGRVYTNYTQLSATSLGRTASGSSVGKKLGGTAADGLNLQNAPKPAPGIPEEYSVRACFKVDVISDLAAAHSKICVEATQDKVSIDVENSGGDIHLFTAATIAEMLGLDLTFDEMMLIKKDPSHPQYKQVKKLRDLSKNVRYSSFNLGGAARLQQTCAKNGSFFTLDECKAAIKAWREVHAPIYNYQMQQIKIANSRSFVLPGHPEYEFGYIESIAGARHYLRKHTNTKNVKIGDKWEKKTVTEVKASDCMSVLWMNTESMVMKKAMILIQRDFDNNPQWKAELNNLAHDEVNATCHDDIYIDDVAKSVFTRMDDCMKEYVKYGDTTSDTHVDTYNCSDGHGGTRRIQTWLDK